jgi:acetyl-CoA acetyltransferase
MSNAFVCGTSRAPIGKLGSALSSTRADDLAAVWMRALVARSPSVDWAEHPAN